MGQYNNYLIAWKKTHATVLHSLKERELDLTGKPEGKDHCTVFAICRAGSIKPRISSL